MSRLPGIAALPVRFLVAPVAVLAVWLIAGTLNSWFFSLSNGLNIATQFAALAIVALGEMLVIMTRGFDISVGAVAALASVAGALTVNQIGVAGLVALPLVGLACGVINGVLIACLRVQPIITTLGMFTFARGLALWLGGGEQTVMLTVSDPLLTFAYLRPGGVPVPLAMVVVLAAAAALALRYLRFGRRLYMIGSDPRSAELVGVPVRSTVIGAYALCGVCAGLAGMLFMSRASAGLPTEGTGLELEAIASAVIGGTALTGGVGSPLPVVLAAFFVQSLLNALNLSGASPFIARIVLGAVIIFAGLLDFVIRRFGSSPHTATGGDP